MHNGHPTGEGNENNDKNDNGNDGSDGDKRHIDEEGPDNFETEGGKEGLEVNNTEDRSCPQPDDMNIPQLQAQSQDNQSQFEASKCGDSIRGVE